jgi:MerR family copper efflux transcriptional regulator
MQIGEVANKTGMAPSAIRFYEQSGLLPAAERRANGYRSYTDATVERLQLIRMAQNLGFSLDAMRSVFGSSEGCAKNELLQKLNARLVELDQLMTTLRAQRRELRDLRATLGQSWAAGQCIDASALASSIASKPERTSRPRPVASRR